MVPTPLTDPEITGALEDLHGWAYDGSRLTRGYSLSGHLAAVAMLVHIATVQEELNHHADLTVVYSKLDIAVNTHSEGGVVTDLDVRLARRIEEIAAGHGAR